MSKQPNIQGRKIRKPEQLRFDFTRGAKPQRCPYCRSKRITAHMGLAECRDCGREWGY